MFKFYKTPSGQGTAKLWNSQGDFDPLAMQQLTNLSELPVVYKHVANMPDTHAGYGVPIGSVVATDRAIIPSAVGVDIGCGMYALRLSLRAEDLPDNLRSTRLAIEAAIPHGRAGWGELPKLVEKRWQNSLQKGFEDITAKRPEFLKANHINHLGSLGGGNHFIELCLDEMDRVWVMLHSGSRGIGNSIGRRFINAAKEEAEKYRITDYLPDGDLAYLVENTEIFDDYVEAMLWSQEFAKINREIMMTMVLGILVRELQQPFQVMDEAINCHHNYAEKEHHFGKNVWVTRKGAVRAREGDLGIIPGSMGAKSFIVRGLGNKDSFCSCSHGAGRVMSRTQAKKEVSMEDHRAALAHVEARVDAGTLDETPSAYKDIDKVMAAQEDLVRVEYTLRQILNVKG